MLTVPSHDKSHCKCSRPHAIVLHPNPQITREKGYTPTRHQKNKIK